jgi:hypothetical protein
MTTAREETGTTRLAFVIALAKKHLKNGKLVRLIRVCFISQPDHS